MSSAVASPIRSSSKKLTSSTYASLAVVGGNSLGFGANVPQNLPSHSLSADFLLSSDFLYAAGFSAAQVDAQLLGGSEDLVVGLDGEQLLQRVGRAVGLHRPALHLAETLAAELRLTAQRLLSDHRVRAGGPSVDLVIDQVVELEDVDVADRDRVGQRLAGAPIEQLRLAGRTHQLLAVPVGQGRREQAGDLLLLGAVEDRSRHLGVRRAVGRADRLEPLLPARVVAVDLPAGLGHPPEEIG